MASAVHCACLTQALGEAKHIEAGWNTEREDCKALLCSGARSNRIWPAVRPVGGGNERKVRGGAVYAKSSSGGDTLGPQIPSSRCLRPHQSSLLHRHGEKNRLPSRKCSEESFAFQRTRTSTMCQRQAPAPVVEEFDERERSSEQGQADHQGSSVPTPKSKSKSKLAVFVSGGGSNFRALYSSTLDEKIYGEVAVVVSDKPSCGGCEYAREHDIPVIAFPKSKAAPDGVSPSRLVTMLLDLGVQYIILAGYLKLIPVELVRAFPKAVLNIHPALLPAFGGKGYFGMRVHEAVIKSGARFSGATVHFVNEEYDTGPIIAQRVVPVQPSDSATDLAQRVLGAEHALYSWVVAALCEDRIVWRHDGVPMVRKSRDDEDDDDEEGKNYL